MRDRFGREQKWLVHLMKDVQGLPKGEDETLCGLMYVEIHFQEAETDPRLFLSRATHHELCGTCHQLLKDMSPDPIEAIT